MRKVHPLVIRLIELRKECGLSQAKVAKAIGIDRTSLLRVESGERVLHADEAVAWASACGGELTLKGPGGDALGMLTAEERRLVQLWRGTDGGQQEVLRLIPDALPHLHGQALEMFLASLRAAAKADLVLPLVG